MICDFCAVAADVMTDWRAAAAQVVAAGGDLDAVERAWLRVRAQYALALHCRGRVPSCTCRHRIREIEETR